MAASRQVSITSSLKVTRVKLWDAAKFTVCAHRWLHGRSDKGNITFFRSGQTFLSKLGCLFPPSKGALGNNLSREITYLTLLLRPYRAISQTDSKGNWATIVSDSSTYPLIFLSPIPRNGRPLRTDSIPCLDLLF